jgi:hypothetical protein
LRVRSPTASGAVAAGSSRSLSPVRASSSPSRPPGGRRRTHEPGRRFLAVASPVASTCSRVAAFACRTYRPLPTDTGLAGYGRHARFEALLPPGVRSATTPALARPGSSVGALLGFLPSRALSTSVLGPVSRADTRRGQSPSTCTFGYPAPRGCRPRSGHRHLGSRAQDPSRARSIEPRASPSGGSPAHTALRERRVRQPPAPSLRPEGRIERASCPCPLFGGTPRLPALHGRIPSRGAPAAGPRRRKSNRSPGPAPREAGWRPGPSRSSVWSPVAGWTPTRLTCVSRASFVTRPLAGYWSVVGPPVARWAGSHGIPFLVEITRRCERRAASAYPSFGVGSLRTRSPTNGSPRARRPVTGTPATP